jgi:hypothetical protein
MKEEEREEKTKKRTIITPILDPPSFEIGSPILSFNEQPTRGE